MKQILIDIVFISTRLIVIATCIYLFTKGTLI